MMPFVELPVLGLRTRFETNSAQVLEAVEESFGCWSRLDPSAVTVGTEVVAVRIVVYGDEEPLDTVSRERVRHVCPDATRLVVQSSQAVGISDPERREAVGFVSAALVADRPHFRSSVLDALTLSLLTHFDRHPVHAAAIVRDRRVVLLAAPSGTGKSTVSYLAQRSGLEVLSDDRVWVQLEPAPRVWGTPARLRLVPEAESDFPELAAHPVVEADGKRKIAVPLRGMGEGMSRVPDDIAVCVMERGGGPALLERLGPEVVSAALSDQLAPGFDRYPARQREVARRLSAGGGWRLRLSGQAAEALPLLRQMLDDGWE
ncbi:MAG: hypothetical protein ACHQRK_08410 [Gemmatimonadales bacterium]